MRRKKKLKTQEIKKLWVSTIDSFVEYQRQAYLETPAYRDPGCNNPRFKKAEAAYAVYRKAHTSLVRLHGKEEKPAWITAMKRLLVCYCEFVTKADVLSYRAHNYKMAMKGW